MIGAGNGAPRAARPPIEILKFYFPGLTIGSVGTAADVDRTRCLPPPPTGAEAPIAPPRPTSRWRCRAAKRASARSCCRSIRTQPRRGRQGDRCAGRRRACASPCIRSVDSFGRATGQPWWVSGATDGAAIDLLPITMLRQQGTARSHDPSRGGARAARWRAGEAADVGEGRGGGVLRQPAERASAEAGSRVRVRATRSYCARSPPARSAMPTRAPKPASRARSPTARSGIRSADGSGPMIDLEVHLQPEPDHARREDARHVVGLREVLTRLPRQHR